MDGFFIQNLEMKYLKYLFFITLLAFVAACSKDDDAIPEEEDKPSQGGGEQTSSVLLPKKELRGVWMATVWGLDWPMEKYDATAQKKMYTDYLDLLVEYNMNAVFFQIRGMADTFYESQYEPWSKYITGNTGIKPTYDVLGFLIEEAHKRGIQFHAWLNPYRIATRASKNSSFPQLDAKIPAELVKDYEKIRIYNPALPEVQTRITDIVKEIITKYDVDGIHMDDYFYPSLESSETMNDAAEYQQYGKDDFKSIEDFRRNNVNVVVQNIQKTIIETRPEVIFSVSPAADIERNYNTLFADVRTWAKEGWVDVVIPQLYFATGTEATSFNLRLDLWSQYTYDNHLLIGYGIYKFGDSQYGSKFQSSDDLKKQFDLANAKSKVKGSVLYSAKNLVENKVDISDAVKALYGKMALLPYLGRTAAELPSTPTNVKLNGTSLSWAAVAGAVYYAIYRDNGKDKEANLIGTTQELSFKLQDKGTYFITALNKVNAESKISEFVTY